MRPDWSAIGAAGRALSGIGLLAAVWILLVQTCSRAFRTHGNDLTAYLLASRALWDGDSPYRASTSFPFVYPLFLAVVLRPLAQLPYYITVGLWFATNAIALFASTRLVCRHGGIAIVTAIAFLGVIQSNLRNGQVNAIVMLLALLFGAAYARGLRALASTLLAAAIALKVTPVLLLIFLARRHEVPMIASIVALMLIFTVGLPWLVAGPSVVDFYGDYLARFVVPRLQGPGDDAFVFSLIGAWGHLSGDTQMTIGMVVSTAAVLAFLVWADRGPSSSARAPRDRETPTMMAVCLYLAATPLVTPVSERHHVIVLMPGLLLLAGHVWRARRLPGAMLAGPVAGLLVAYGGVTAMRFVPGAAFVAVTVTCALLALAIGPMGSTVSIASIETGQPSESGEPGEPGQSIRPAGPAHAAPAVRRRVRQGGMT